MKKVYTLTLTRNQYLNLFDCVREDYITHEDYLCDGTFDSDQEEKEEAINRVNDLGEVLDQLGKGGK